VTRDGALPTPRSRATAVVELVLTERAPGEALALDVEREYRAYVRIEGRVVSSGVFRSPLGDERWRDVLAAMRASAAAAEPGRTPERRVLDAGRRLYDGLAGIAPELERFLAQPGSPRRLVIASDRPEVHRLPWEAMIDTGHRHVAEGDLSVVHAVVNAFEPVPWTAPETLRVAAILGPDTPGATRAALARMAPLGQARRGLVGEVLRPASADELRARLAASEIHVVHVEAHGDNERATITLAPGLAADPAGLATTIGPRPIVLFWTCYSGLLQSWGESPGLTLQRAGSRLVVGFSTEVRQETAGEVASRFYGTLLHPREGGDPEGALTRERARIFADERRGCVWASLTVWLRQPLDCTAATREGPRLPAGAWTDAAGGAAEEPFRTALGRAGEGRHQVAAGVSLAATLPKRLVDEYPGAAVRLSGQIGVFSDAPISPASLREVIDGLGGQARSDHPADAVLAMLGTLAGYRRSLLVWSGASRAEVDFFGLLDAIPRNLAVLLVTDEPARRAPEAGGRDGQPANEGGRPAPSLGRLAELVEHGQFEEADEVWRALAGEAARWDDSQWQQQLAYQADGFWVAVKRWQNAEALERTVKLEAKATAVPESARHRLDFEWRMLRANLLAREARHDEAFELYRQAGSLADQRASAADRARASAEMGYLLAETGDVVGAEQLYRNSIGLLEGVQGAADRGWRSALARALRDLADLLLSDPARREEARQLLRRSLALHALDGRYDQLGAVLRTRGRLLAAEGEHDLATRSLEAAAAVAARTCNAIGWAATMRELAGLALRCGRYEQCTRVLEQLIAHLQARAADRSPEIGLAASQLARAYWQLGRADEALAWCLHARAWLPEALRREHTEVSNLEQALRPLTTPRQPAAPGVPSTATGK